MKSKVDYFNNLYKEMLVNTPQTTKVKIPENYGEGVISQTTTKHGIIISDWQLKYHSDICLQGESAKDSLHMIFCFECGMSWDIMGEQTVIDIEKDEVVFYNTQGKIENAYYKGDCNYNFKSIKIPYVYFFEILENYFELYEVEIYRARLLSEVSKITITPNIKRTVLEIKDFLLYRGGLGHMFLEAKILELMSMFLGEVLELSVLKQSKTRISRSDRETVMEAKRYIDSRIDDAPSYKEIAEYVHVSISKLSKDFADFIGLPIHTYIIEQRLEKSTLLLAKDNLTISQVASLVGYNKSSNFTEAFRKKYGMTPSEYRATI